MSTTSHEQRRSDVEDAAATIFAAHCGPQVVDAAEAGSWPDPLWQHLEDASFTRVGLEEQHGGPGGDLADACDVLFAAGRAASPLPLVEHGLLGSWLLASAGLELPPGLITATSSAPQVKDGVVSGVLKDVPWAERAATIVAVTEDNQVVALRPDQVRLIEGRNLAGEPLATAVAESVDDAVVAPAPAPVSRDAFLARGALGYAAQLCGAMAEARDLSVEYAAVRQQFTKPINRFQAVATHLVVLAEETALAEAALHAAVTQTPPSLTAAATAKIVAEEAATAVAAAAHQVHGAIGMTREYPLGRLTRRLWAWRDTFGNAETWSAQLGRQCLSGADAFWPLVVPGLEIARSAASLT